MKIEGWWLKRIKLLEAIKKCGCDTPISILSRDIYAIGASAHTVSKQLEAKGFIIKEKHGRMVKTKLTIKGEELLYVLIQLKEMWED